MSWIAQVKDQVSPVQVAGWLGMEGSIRSFGPCPVCREDARGADDPRGPIGMNQKGGWACFRCSAKGDAVELAAQGVLGRSSGDLAGEDLDRLRAWFVERGVRVDDRPPPQQGRGGSRQRAAAPPVRSVSEIAGGRQRPRQQAAAVEEPEVEPPPGAPEGTFGWSDDLVPRCEVALWGPTPEAARARAYLGERRGLTDAALKAYRVGLYVHPDGRPWVVSGRPIVVIPLQDEHERPVNVKFRAVPTPGTCEHCTSDDGCKKCRSYRACRGRPLPLFGAHRLATDRSKPVVVVEGELDAIAMYALGFKSNVVSTTAGAGVAWPDPWLDLLEPFQAVIGLYDDDEKGREGWEKAADVLGRDRCSRGIVPAGKDVNACLVDGLAEGQTRDEIAERILRALERAMPGHGMAMRRAEEFQAELEVLINDPSRLRGLPTGSAKIDHALGGLRPGLMVVSGESGNGKTSFATWFCWQQARHDVGVMLTSFEQRPLGTVQKLLRAQIGGDFTLVAPETRAEALSALSDLDLWILDHYGQVPLEKVVDSIRYAKRRHGVRVFMIDHLQFLIEPDAADERQEIQRVMRTLAILAKQEDVSIILICHVANFDMRGMKGDDARPTMRNLKGGSAIRQDADEVVIVVARPPSKAQKREWPATDLYFDKVRSEFGTSGAAVRLAYDPGSTTYADSWEETPAGEAGKIVPR